jgi:hypothetical protein
MTFASGDGEPPSKGPHYPPNTSQLKLVILTYMVEAPGINRDRADVRASPGRREWGRFVISATLARVSDSALPFPRRRRGSHWSHRFEEGFASLLVQVSEAATRSILSCFRRRRGELRPGGRRRNLPADTHAIRHSSARLSP